jgi:hypothetical protein
MFNIVSNITILCYQCFTSFSVFPLSFSMFFHCFYVFPHSFSMNTPFSSQLYCLSWFSFRYFKWLLTLFFSTFTDFFILYSNPLPYGCDNVNVSENFLFFSEHFSFFSSSFSCFSLSVYSILRCFYYFTLILFHDITINLFFYFM